MELQRGWCQSPSCVRWNCSAWRGALLPVRRCGPRPRAGSCEAQNIQRLMALVNSMSARPEKESAEKAD